MINKLLVVADVFTVSIGRRQNGSRCGEAVEIKEFQQQSRYWRIHENMVFKLMFLLGICMCVCLIGRLAQTLRGFICELRYHRKTTTKQSVKVLSVSSFSLKTTRSEEPKLPM